MNEWSSRSMKIMFEENPGVPVVEQWLTNPTRNHEVAVLSLALLSGLRIWCCRELWCRSDPALLWLWCRPAAVALIRPLAWELPHASGVALKRPKKKKIL